MARSDGPRWTFFAGKGGVGKTTCAAAYALARSTASRVLVVSTDPAHSLADALNQRLFATVRPVRGRARLFAAELDADRALSRWLSSREGTLRAIAERGTYFDAEDLDRFFGLSLPGVDELFGLVELDRLSQSGDWDEVVVDTAPTGHILRLLQMPEALARIAGVLDDMQEKHRVVASSLAGRWRPDSADALIDELDEQARALTARLRDESRCVFRWVTLPERMSVEETTDGLGSLEAFGITVDEVVVNRLTPPPRGRCHWCEAQRAEQARVLKEAQQVFGARRIRLLAAMPEEPRGTSALGRLGRALVSNRPALALPASRRSAPLWPRASSTLALPVPPSARLLLFTGKGGVGKTSCAAAAALALARENPRRRVLVLSIDPAHSLGDVLGQTLSDEPARVEAGPPNFFARELDADRAFEASRARYQEAVDAFFDSLRGGGRLDAVYDRNVARDLFELAPPGADELFALLAAMDLSVPVSKSGEHAPFDLLVLDTAPTGHTLRLLELPAKASEWVHALMQTLLKYQSVARLGALAEDMLRLSRQLKAFRELLADSSRSAVYAVTRPAELPARETGRLLGALAKLSLPCPALLVNATASAGGRRCARCRAAGRREAGALAALERPLASLRPKGPAVILAPAVAPPPRGAEALLRFALSWTRR